MWNRRSFASSLIVGLCSGAAFARGLRAVLPAAEASAVGFSVMLWTLKDRGSLEANLETVAQAGFGHVELVDEFKGWSDADFDRILAKMRALHLTVDAMAGMKLGFADPSGGDAFVAELKTLIPVARRLGCGQTILLSGKRLPGVSPEQQHAAAIATLKRSAEVLRGAGIVGVIEPIDRLENPAVYLDGVTEAFAIVRSVASPHVKVLYDLYHEQRGLGNLIEKLEKNIDEVGLIHIADVPGRHEPGTGEVNFSNVYAALRRLRYSGVIAMEFYPTGDPVERLRRAREEAVRCLSS